MTAPALTQPPFSIAKVGSATKKGALTKEQRLERRKARWFGALFFAICFEGLGRKYLPEIPGEVFYFLKDLVLLYGIVAFPRPRRLAQVMRFVFRPFDKFLMAAVALTLVEVINTSLRASFFLGILGLRAYWLWWFAMPVVASVVLSSNVRRSGINVMAFVCAVVAVFAMIQFGSPSTSATNTYAIQAGNEVVAFEVASTGRVRVSSTFTFITGFTDFVVLIPPLLLSLGLSEGNRRVRLLANVSAMLAAAALPMSGSRAPFIVGLFLLALVAQQAGFLFTPIGRRVLVGAILAFMTMLYVFPDSLQGVQDRFNSDDTKGRFESQYEVVPFIALTKLSYPLLGLGTGMQQNFRNFFGVDWGEYESEAEPGRLLIELGIAGYLLIWITRFGLLVALLRAASLLKRANRRAAAGVATAFALLVFYGNLAFDHVWQALFFTGCGFILGELLRVWPILFPERRPLAAADWPSAPANRPPEPRLLPAPQDSR
ncbi:MAG TPA: hypothetical protein VGL59_13625 [Polyangia bacterium]|jgi:hypothetical protein